MPLDLVAILLAVDSTRGPVLAFRHPAPPPTSKLPEDNSSPQIPRPTRNKTATISSSETEGLNIYDLSADDLASLLTPKPALYDSRFQLDVDDLTFLGLPFPWRSTPSFRTPQSAVGAPSLSSKASTAGGVRPRRSSIDTLPTGDAYVRGFLSPPAFFRPSPPAPSSSSANPDGPRPSTSPGHRRLIGRGHGRTMSAAAADDMGEAALAAEAEAIHAAEADDSSHTHGFQLTMFHIVFVLRAGESGRQKALDTAFTLAVRKLSVALRSEQMRSGYVQHQVELMLAAIEAAHHDSCDRHEVHSRLLASSALARDLADVYDALEEDDVARFPASGSGSYALQLTSPYLRQPPIPSPLPVQVPVSPPPATGQEYTLRPYQTLLLTASPETVLVELPSDSSAEVESFLLELTPMLSFEDVAGILSLGLEEVYSMARILLEWRKAQVIDAISVRGVYVPSPQARLANFDALSAEFASSFPPLKLPDLLSALALRGHVPFSSHIPDRSRRAIFLEALIFLLQHHLVRRLHPYIIAIVPRGEEDGIADVGAAGENCQVEQEWVKAVVAGMGRDVGKLFSRLYRYFDGSFHVAEIAAREGLEERVIEELLGKLKNEVVTYMC